MDQVDEQLTVAHGILRMLDGLKFLEYFVDPVDIFDITESQIRVCVDVWLFKATTHDSITLGIDVWAAVKDSECVVLAFNE